MSKRLPAPRGWAISSANEPASQRGRLQREQDGRHRYRREGRVARGAAHAVGMRTSARSPQARNREPARRAWRAAAADRALQRRSPPRAGRSSSSPSNDAARIRPLCGVHARRQQVVADFVREDAAEGAADQRLLPRLREQIERPSAPARARDGRLDRGDVDCQRRRRHVVVIELDRAEALAAERRGWPPCRPGAGQCRAGRRIRTSGVGGLSSCSGATATMATPCARQIASASCSIVRRSIAGCAAAPLHVRRRRRSS